MAKPIPGTWAADPRAPRVPAVPLVARIVARAGPTRTVKPVAWHRASELRPPTRRQITGKVAARPASPSLVERTWEHR